MWSQKIPFNLYIFSQQLQHNFFYTKFEVEIIYNTSTLSTELDRKADIKFSKSQCKFKIIKESFSNY